MNSYFASIGAIAELSLFCSEELAGAEEEETQERLPRMIWPLLGFKVNAVT